MFLVFVLLYFSASQLLMIEAMQQTILELFPDYIKLLSDVKKLESDIRQQKIEIRQNTKTISDKISRKPVSFYAYLQASKQVAVGNTIIFNAIETNMGGAYDGITGQFTVPKGEGGIYVFSWTISAHHGTVFSELLVNSKRVGNILTDASMRGDDYNTVTGVVVAKIKDGDKVYVICPKSYYAKCSYVQSKGNQKSSFSGWRIKEAT